MHLRHFPKSNSLSVVWQINLQIPRLEREACSFKRGFSVRNPSVFTFLPLTHGPQSPSPECSYCVSEMRTKQNPRTWLQTSQVCPRAIPLAVGDMNKGMLQEQRSSLSNCYLEPVGKHLADLQVGLRHPKTFYHG